MVFKLKINFTSPVEIQDNNLLPLHKRIVIVMTPFPEDQVAGGYDNKKVDPYWSATYMGTTYSNAWSFMPSSLELNKGIFPNVNGYFIVSVPSELNLMHSLTKTYKFIYVEDAGHQKLKRLGVASNTTSSTNVTINGVMTLEDGTLKSTVPPKILSAEVSDENPEDIIFKFTNGRTLTIDDENAFKGAITSSNANSYGQYSLGAVTVDNDNKFVKVSAAGGKLTKNSIISLNTIEDEDDVGQDEFGFKLVKSTNFPTFKNNIKNPKLFGFITPSDNKNGNLVLRLSKDEGNTFISNINYKNNAGDYTASPHNEIDVSDDSNLQQNFPSFGLIAVENLDETNNNFKNEVSSHFNEQVVKLRSNRFARSDLNYTVSYSPQADFQNSGIFETKGGQDHHAVLEQLGASSMKNLLQPIVIDTISEVKVVYDSTKTTEDWSSITALGDGDSYSSYAAYYYVDITFKNANTNQPVLITAKYNGDVDDDGNINCQYSGGHEIHHGLILNYNNQEIPEEITQTTIRNNNGNVVDLRSGANGSILRIEFPAGNNDGGTKNAYNTDTNNPTSYGFTDPTKSLTLTFSDKQKKNWQGDQIENEFYFLNVMDSDGNVCLPFTKNVLFPNNWGMDKFGQLPKIVSAAVNVTYSEGAWSNKKLTLTFNQDIYNTPNVPIILNKDLELELSNQVTLTGKTISGKTITYDVVDINRNDGLSVSYDKPIGVGLSNGIYDNILYNWFGFEIYSFPNFPVINNLPVIPSIKNIVFTNIVEGETSFGATLTWELTNDRLLGLDQNPVDSSKISEYTIETASTFNATTWTTVNGNLQDPNISFIAEGLNYNEDVFVRIRAKTYDFGEYTVSDKIIRFKISQQLTFPEISFLDASQEDQLPIRIGDATQDMTQSDTRDNLSTHEIYWSYKPTTGEQANNWGGQLYQALGGLDIPVQVGEMPVENDGPDLVELYGGGENIPDAVAPGVAWLKMPVFWQSDEAQDGTSFTDYPEDGTGGLPWYNAATGTFNNLINTGGPDDTNDMTTPLELKFIMINKNQGVAAGTSDVKDHTIVYNVPTIENLSFQALGPDERIIQWDGIPDITRYRYYSQGVNSNTTVINNTVDFEPVLITTIFEIGAGEFGIRGEYVSGNGDVSEGVYATIIIT